MKKCLVLFGIALVVGIMTTLVAYSVTLYRLFCELTGAGGYIQRVAADTAARSDGTVTVFFDTNVVPGLPWRFAPVQRKITVHLGEQTPVFFEAENRSNEDIVGHATFNVTPDKAAVYFKKIQCFCFTEERLSAHQKVDMPVLFYVDPKLAADRETRDVDQITLSYTFFRSIRPDRAQDLARFDSAPGAETGTKLFQSQCGSCHDLHQAKAGPPLAGILGRRAGSAAGYVYSPALAKSGIVWTEASLEKWLAGPQAYVPGALMPLAVPDEAARREIIGYLNAVSPKRNAAEERAGAVR